MTITLQAERPLDAGILPEAKRSSPPPIRAPQAALPCARPDDGAASTAYASVSGGGNAPALVPSPLVGLSIGLVQASMFWPVLQPV